MDRNRTYLVDMMKRMFAMVVLCGAASLGLGQNLIPNGDFEQYLACPSFGNLEQYCVGWEGIGGSPDYFNRCAENDTSGVPFNFAGYQEPHSGDGYIGLTPFLLGNPYAREMARCQLVQPLQPGQLVYISFWAATGGFGSLPESRVRYATNGLGLKFSVLPQDQVGYWPGNVALSAEEVLVDTSIWYHITGSYLPDSGYAWLSIGCFLPDEDITFEVLDTSIQASNYSYAFIDDLCISADPDNCDANSGLTPHDGSGGITVYVNYGGTLVIDNSVLTERWLSIALYNVHGQVVLRGTIAQGVTSHYIDVSALPEAAYVLAFSDDRSFVKNIKFAVVSP